MQKEKIHWDSKGDYLPSIDPHTKSKHQILEEYIKRYIETLCGNNLGNRKVVTFIDGFCGGGAYIDEQHRKWKGSPLIIVEAVEEALNIVKTKKSKPNYELDVKFIFIDSAPNHISCLKKQFQEYGLVDCLTDNTKCEFVVGEFADSLEECLSEVRKRKGSSFFFLDPFGWTDVPMASFRSIMSLGKTEILYTFMIDFVKRFLGSRDGKLQSAFQNILEADGYYELLREIDDLENIAKHSYVRNETLRLFRNRGQFAYVCAFALMPKATTPLYYLIHLADNPAAQREMKFTLWNHNTLDLTYQFQYGVYGLGFRTLDYYEECYGQLFDIKEDNIRRCIENLNDNLMPLIYNSQEGIPFGKLHNSTMQENPATWDHYEAYIDQQRKVQELEVIRKGKITHAKRLMQGDIIRKFQFKQFSLLLKK